MAVVPHVVVVWGIALAVTIVTLVAAMIAAAVVPPVEVIVAVAWTVALNLRTAMAAAYIGSDTVTLVAAMVWVAAAAVSPLEVMAGSSGIDSAIGPEDSNGCSLHG